MFEPSPTAITEVLSDENWVANLPQLLRYGQRGDVIQVPNASVLALAEQLMAAGGMATGAMTSETASGAVDNITVELTFVLAP